MSLTSTSRLRLRLVMKQTLPFAALISLLAWAAYALVTRHIYSVIDDELQDRAIGVRSMLQIRRNAITWLKEQADPEVRERFEKSVHYYQLLDHDGKVVESSGEHFSFSYTATARQSMASGLPTYETFKTDSGVRVRVFNSLVEGQQRTRYLMRVGISLAEVDEISRNIGLLIAVIFPAVIMLQAASSWLAVRSELPSLEPAVAGLRNAPPAERSLAFTNKNDASGPVNAPAQPASQPSFHRTSEFLQNLSHELRQPLTVLRAETEQALRMANLSEDYRRMLSKQLEHVEMLSRTISSLLAVAQSEDQNIKLHRKQEDLFELVQAAMDGMQTSASERNIVISGDLQQNVVGEYDAGQIWRLILNLIDNAIKFTPPQGEIKVTLTADDEYAVIAVGDTGCGIAPADLPRIFERSFRATSAVKSGIPGTGLGLHFARSIAEAHGGRIEVSSKVGKGTCFRVVLPLHAPHAGRQPAEGRPAQSIN